MRFYKSVSRLRSTSRFESSSEVSSTYVYWQSDEPMFLPSLSSLELLFTPASFAAQDTSFAWGEIFRIDFNSQFHIHTFLCSFLKMIFAKGTQPGQVGLKLR